MILDFGNIFYIFLNFINSWCIGIHWTVHWGILDIDFYPFVFLCCVVITELVFDLFFPRPKGDD